MPIYRHGNGFMHLKMTNTKKRPAPPPCREILRREGQLPVRCAAMSTMLCDWPTAAPGETCSKPICPEHGRAIGAELHLCAAHMTLWLSRSAKERRAIFPEAGIQPELFV